MSKYTLLEKDDIAELLKKDEKNLGRYKRKDTLNRIDIDKIKDLKTKQLLLRVSGRGEHELDSIEREFYYGMPDIRSGFLLPKNYMKRLKEEESEYWSTVTAKVRTEIFKIIFKKETLIPDDYKFPKNYVFPNKILVMSALNTPIYDEIEILKDKPVYIKRNIGEMEVNIFENDIVERFFSGNYDPNGDIVETKATILGCPRYIVQSKKDKKKFMFIGYSKSFELNKKNPDFKNTNYVLFSSTMNSKGELIITYISRFRKYIELMLNKGKVLFDEKKEIKSWIKVRDILFEKI